MNRERNKLDDTFGIDDIGSRLLEELAKGLYDPREVIREYVQNAVDAHRLWKDKEGYDPEGPIQIELMDSGNLIVSDWGIGMGEEEIRNVKSIGVSDKEEEPTTLTGYKGVGIWAGLSFFDRLIITSTKKGIRKLYTLEIMFGDIIKSFSPGKDLGRVLDPNFDIYEQIESDSEHYTRCKLIGPKSGTDIFSNVESIKKAVRETCPCNLDPNNFGRYEEIKNWYERNGIETFDIRVNGEGVSKSYPSNIHKPEFQSISIDGEEVAKAWFSYTKDSSRLEPESNQLVGTRIYEKGFVVGNKNQYADREMQGFSEVTNRSYLDWQVGEIHIKSEDIMPGLQRSELESSPISNAFIDRVRDIYNERLKRTRTVSEKNKNRKRYDQIRNLINKYKDDVPLNDEQREDLVEALETVKGHEQRFQGHKGKQTSDPKVQAVRDRKMKRRRKRLLNDLADLLPDIESGSDEGSNGDVEPPSDRDSSNSSSGTANDTGSSSSHDHSGDDKESGDGDAPPLSIEVDDTETERRSVPLGFALDVLRDVLMRIFDDREQRVDTAINQFKSYLKELYKDVE